MRTVRLAVVSLTLLLPLGAADNARAAGSVSLVDAIRNGDATAIRKLAEDRSQVNAVAPDGTTPLHWAAYLDNLEAATALLRAQANPNAADRYGITPLLLASSTGNAALIELLLKAGANANAAGADGETALMTASRTGNVDAVTALLTHGANPNAKERSHDQTALMWAASDGHTAVVRALVAGGANVTERERAGFTAYLFAVRAGQADTVKLLLELGVDVNDATTLPPAGGRQM